MSAYASLPGSILPPFTSFGAQTTKDTTKEGSDLESSTLDLTCISLNIDQPSSPTSVIYQSLKGVCLPAFDINALCNCSGDANRDEHKAFSSLQFYSQSSPSDTNIEVQAARVDPAALLKSLVSTGSNADHIHDADEENNHEIEEDEDTASQNIAAANNQCDGYEDTTDYDDEYSMYDYSEDFSAPFNDDARGDVYGDHKDWYPSAIVFELSINFQGRKYNATRRYPTFVKLRDDLARELCYEKGGTVNGGDGLGILAPLVGESLSVPDLPTVLPGDRVMGGYTGFVLLRETAQHCHHEIEDWIMHVANQFPYSMSLSRFLWEPLVSINSSLDTIEEEVESMNTATSLLD